MPESTHEDDAGAGQERTTAEVRLIEAEAVLRLALAELLAARARYVSKATDGDLVFLREATEIFAKLIVVLMIAGWLANPVLHRLPAVLLH